MSCIDYEQDSFTFSEAWQTGDVQQVAEALSALATVLEFGRSDARPAAAERPQACYTLMEKCNIYMSDTG